MTEKKSTFYSTLWGSWVIKKHTLCMLPYMSIIVNDPLITSLFTSNNLPAHVDMNRTSVLVSRTSTPAPVEIGNSCNRNDSLVSRTSTPAPVEIGNSCNGNDSLVYDRTTNTNIDISNIYYRYHLAKGTARYDVFGASLTHR